MSEIDFGRYYPEDGCKNNCENNLNTNKDEKILFAAFDLLKEKKIKTKKKEIKEVKSPKGKKIKNF